MEQFCIQKRLRKKIQKIVQLGWLKLPFCSYFFCKKNLIERFFEQMMLYISFYKYGWEIWIMKCHIFAKGYSDPSKFFVKVEKCTFATTARWNQPYEIVGAWQDEIHKLNWRSVIIHGIQDFNVWADGSLLLYGFNSFLKYVPVIHNLIVWRDHHSELFKTSMKSKVLYAQCRLLAKY